MPMRLEIFANACLTGPTFLKTKLVLVVNTKKTDKMCY